MNDLHTLQSSVDTVHGLNRLTRPQVLRKSQHLLTSNKLNDLP